VAGRAGFQRLVAEVSVAHVGIIVGLEMSRLARAKRAWHPLLAVCALFGTLIGALDGISDPTDDNDRLLWGLKGAMSDAELPVLTQRMMAGKRAKAARGALGMPVPRGYGRRPSGEVMQEPDEQAQAVIARIVDQGARVGTIHAVFRSLVQHPIRVPQRVRCGPRKGELVWRRPQRTTLRNLLHPPIYAGAYTDGRRPTDPKRTQPGRPSTGRAVAKPEACQGLRPDRIPAYMSGEQFERNRRQLEAKTQAGLGVIRSGPSLLSGLVVCGRCGLRMAAASNHNGAGLRYSCAREMVDDGGAICQSFTGAPLDAWMSAFVLEALEPAALEVSLEGAADVEAQRQRLHQHWAKRLERAGYEVARAARQYHAVDPENRLVARTLERQWAEAFASEERLKADYRRLLASHPVTLSAGEREALRRLASDLPARWHAETTTAADRQAIIRHLVERVVVTVQGESEHVDPEGHGIGGHRTQTRRLRPVARLDQCSYSPALLARAAALPQQGLRRGAIAEGLNAAGGRPAKRRQTFTADMGRALLVRQGLRASKARPRSVTHEAEAWTLPKLAYTLARPHPTLDAWLRQGHLQARHDPGSGQWLIRADASARPRLRAFRQAPRLWKRPAPRASSQR
jgi:DNA invertase Pin-like site-specific DNA recombinase